MLTSRVSWPIGPCQVANQSFSPCSLDAPEPSCCSGGARSKTTLPGAKCDSTRLASLSCSACDRSVITLRISVSLVPERVMMRLLYDCVGWRPTPGEQRGPPWHRTGKSDRLRQGSELVGADAPADVEAHLLV